MTGQGDERRPGLPCPSRDRQNLFPPLRIRSASGARALLGFASIVGNFGVVLMIGGNIPGRTRVMSTAIFDYVETMQWREANILAAGMVVFAFVVILSMTLVQKRYARAEA